MLHLGQLAKRRSRQILSWRVALRQVTDSAEWDKWDEYEYMGTNGCWTCRPCDVAALATGIDQTPATYMGQAEPSHALDLAGNSIHRAIEM